ncbi:hypothetical protein [Nocardioides caricicola]|uniref:Uncharacterized protein n=1 Tax=Nocardioides caricicola TaxID=634770 RepID=A0ABW0N474_9ACTN
MTENPENPQNPENTENTQPQKRFRDRRVGVVALAASTVGALLIGGTLGAVSGAAIGYGVGHDDHPDRPAIVHREVPPGGELPPGMAPEDSSDSSNS